MQCLVSGNAAKPKLSGKGHNKSATTDLLLQPGHLFQLYKEYFQPQTFSLHLDGVLSQDKPDPAGQWCSEVTTGT